MVSLSSSEVTGNLPRRANTAQERHFGRAARLALRAAAVETADRRVGIDRAARLAAQPQPADPLVGLGLRDGRDQGSRIGVLGIGEQLGGRTLLDDPAEI